MNVVIIPSDGFVSVNGRGFGDLDLSWIAPEVHAVNWRGTSGEVQIVDPDTLMAVRNDEITDLAPFQQALEQWESARAIADAPPPHPDSEPLTQFELDQRRYQRRAAVQSELIAWMAADNMSRVRSGTWTVAQLTSLMSDPALQAANAYMSTLSYELAAQAISQATNALMTPAIKAAWVAKLTEHFYLEP